MDVVGPRWRLQGREETSVVSSEMLGDVMLLRTSAATAGGNSGKPGQRDVRWGQVKLPPGFTRTWT